MWISILVAIAIAINTFSRGVSGALSTPKITNSMVAKTATIMAIGHFLLFLIGGWAGNSMDNLLYRVMQNASLGIMLLVGAKMIYYSIREKADDRAYDLNHSIVPVALAFATGVDSFLCGIAFDFIRISALQPATMVAIFVFASVIIGIKVGKKHGVKLIKLKFGILAGIIIIVTAILKFYHILH